MKVQDILTHFGFRPLTVTDSHMDPQTQSWVNETVPNNKIILGYGVAHAGDRELLMRNLEADLEHVTILGPLALFAFKIRGPKMAIYQVNMMPLGGMGYQIMRFNRYGKSIGDKHEDMLTGFLEWSKQGLIQESSDYFNVWKTVAALEDN